MARKNGGKVNHPQKTTSAATPACAFTGARGTKEHQANFISNQALRRVVASSLRGMFNAEVNVHIIALIDAVSALMSSPNHWLRAGRCDLEPRALDALDLEPAASVWPAPTCPTKPP